MTNNEDNILNKLAKAAKKVYDFYGVKDDNDILDAARIEVTFWRNELYNISIVYPETHRVLQAKYIEDYNIPKELKSDDK